jgi:hypothetical protein
MSGHNYILVGHEPEEEPDLLKWAKWFENAPGRIVKQEQIGEYRVSTVFLGMNHNFGDGAPLLFETMVFGGDQDGEYQKRCSTWDEAEAMHAQAVAGVIEEELY